MKRLALTASLALTLATASFALPKPNQLPGNLFWLAASDATDSTIAKKFVEKGVTVESALKLYPPQVAAQISECGLADFLQNITSATFGVTINRKTSLPNGFIMYVEGAFSAPELIQKVVACPTIQDELKKDPAGEDVAVSLGKSKQGKTLVFTAAGDKVPGEVAKAYPPLAKGFKVTLEATAPNTLRIASSGALPRGKNVLSPDSPFAKVLALEKGVIGRQLIRPVDKTIAALTDRLIAAKPEAEEFIEKARAVSIVDAFITMKAVDISMKEAGDAITYSAAITAASPDKATEIQEALIGYKVIAKTALDVMASEMPPEVAPQMKCFSEILASFKVSAPKGSTVTTSLVFTLDQYVTFFKALESFERFQGSVSARGGSCDAGCDHDDDDDDDDIEFDIEIDE